MSSSPSVSASVSPSASPSAGLPSILDTSSFIDLEYFNTMTGLSIVEGSDEETRFIVCANAVINIMEYFCGRKLKSRTYLYTNADDEEFTIFDAPEGTNFWFPAYPVTNIAAFYISDVLIAAATSYSDTTGYFLNKKMGKLTYFYGFDYNYLQNIKTSYTAGYGYATLEYRDLQKISYDLIFDMYDNSSGVSSSNVISERIGEYSYTKANPKDLTKFQGIFPDQFFALSKYKRFIIQ
jgi:hypothetical protein